MRYVARTIITDPADHSRVFQPGDDVPAGLHSFADMLANGGVVHAGPDELTKPVPQAPITKVPTPTTRPPQPPAPAKDK